METNNELELAWEFVEHTGISIFLTGKAGTGKTTFLKSIIEKSCKRSIVVAPTGVAAINAHGVTIHSFFQLPFSPYVPNTTIKEKYDFSKEKRNIVKTLDLLIIDEISMVRCDLLDAIDSVLRRYKDANKPFGGVQLLMIGDLQQLTPVVTDDDADILRPYYNTPYFFGSHALQQINYVTIELLKVYRQQDRKFLDLLNSIRSGKPTQDDINALNSRCNPEFHPDNKDGYIRLTTHNSMADRYNDSELDKLETEAFIFNAVIKGNFPEYSYPTSETLVLKENAQVMFVKNDPSFEHLYYNGKIGHITNISEECIRVRCSGEDSDIEVKPQEWENTKYVINKKTKEIEADVQGVFKQYPLRLAWAITIHKSQGLTFEHAIIDAGASFASGQVYVALSRCKTLEGMVLASKIDNHVIINDQRVDAYIFQQEETARQNVERLELLKQSYYKQQLIELFTFNDIMKADESLCRTVIEYLHSYPKLTILHKSTMKSLEEKVNIVSHKWINTINVMNYDELRESAFQERVVKSAKYFNSMLKTYILQLLDQTATAKIENKSGATKLDATYCELKLAYLAKRNILEMTIDNGFDSDSYLKNRQTAYLDAIDEVNPIASATRRKKKDGYGTEITDKPKVKKENTKELTLIMYKSGIMPEEIAKARDFTIGTIFSHLTYYVETGELNALDVIGKMKYDIINKAVNKIGTSKGLKPIKDICPDDIDYGEIRMVVAAKLRTAKTSI
jgi:hypothetical protein